MGGPAVGGAPGPALPDLIVLEVGVAEVPQGRPEGARGRLACVFRPLVPALLHESELVCAGGWNGHYGIQTNAVVSRVESEKTQ